MRCDLCAHLHFYVGGETLCDVICVHIFTSKWVERQCVDVICVHIFTFKWVERQCVDVICVHIFTFKLVERHCAM